MMVHFTILRRWVEPTKRTTTTSSSIKWVSPSVPPSISSRLAFLFLSNKSALAHQSVTIVEHSILLCLWLARSEFRQMNVFIISFDSLAEQSIWRGATILMNEPHINEDNILLYCSPRRGSPSSVSQVWNCRVIITIVVPFEYCRQRLASIYIVEQKRSRRDKTEATRRYLFLLVLFVRDLSATRRGKKSIHKLWVVPPRTLQTVKSSRLRPWQNEWSRVREQQNNNMDFIKEISSLTFGNFADWRDTKLIAIDLQSTSKWRWCVQLTLS